MLTREVLSVAIINAAAFTFIGFIIGLPGIFFLPLAFGGFFPGIVVAYWKNSGGQYRWEFGEALVISFVAGCVFSFLFSMITAIGIAITTDL